MAFRSPFPARRGWSVSLFPFSFLPSLLSCSYSHISSWPRIGRGKGYDSRYFYRPLVFGVASFLNSLLPLRVRPSLLLKVDSSGLAFFKGDALVHSRLFGLLSHFLRLFLLQLCGLFSLPLRPHPSRELDFSPSPLVAWVLGGRR